MAERTPAQTAHADQIYAVMRDALDAMVRDSRETLDDLSDQQAAETLAASIVNKDFHRCTIASYLALAIVRLQRQEADRG
ncbi:hypothetical protein ACIRG5_42475 [Lentzea sp. NPDC102401]|uniref:hypothetical protein n=1 Tax=Lentzea sp. NPDC102401 TaxID=3364128 RepID=UPI003802D180